MRRSDNILQFSGRSAGDASLKLFVVLFHLGVAYLLTFGLGLSSNGLTALLVLGLMYHFFVRQRFSGMAYFRKNAILLGVILLIVVLLLKVIALFFLVMAGAYWLLVGRSRREAPYFLKYHVLTAIIMDSFILLAYLLLSSLLGFVISLFNVFHLTMIVGPMVNTVPHWLGLGFVGLFLGGALFLAVSAIRGRTPYLPVITDNVRYLS